MRADTDEESLWVFELVGVDDPVEVLVDVLDPLADGSEVCDRVDRKETVPETDAGDV